MANFTNLRTRIKQILLFNFIIFTFLCGNYANADPQWFYRVDSRAPELVFNNGFKSRGANDNIVDHLLGRSIHQPSETPPTAFISVTTDLNTYATRYAGRLLSPQVNYGYVYIIRPTANIYSMEITLNNMYSNQLINRDTLNRLLTDVRRQSEWVAYQDIPIDQIYGVYPFTIDNYTDPFHPTIPNIVLNPNYNNDANPVVNNSPYPNTAITLQTPSARWVEWLEPLVTLGFDPNIYCITPANNLISHTTNQQYPDYCAVVNTQSILKGYEHFIQISPTDNIYAVDNSTLQGLVRVIPNPNHGTTELLYIPYYIKSEL